MFSPGSVLGGTRGRLRSSGALLLAAGLMAACTTTSRAPVVDMSTAEPAAPSAPIPGAEAPAAGASYVVRPGDTLYSIARAHNVGWQDVANWNSITDPSQLRVGQSLRIESGAAGAPQTVDAGTAVAQVEPIVGGGVQSRPLDGAAPGAPAQPPAAKPSPANDSGIDWLWPANGRVVEQFNESLNKGIDIEGQEGDPVVAAADGVVVYSGSGLRGYGNLIIVRHNASFLSAYAHNSRLLATEGQNVRRGETIAELGQTDAPSPRLHFEIRRGGTPEDPMRFLPQR